MPKKYVKKGRRGLGSVISSFKYKARTKNLDPAQQFDIQQVIKRLEDYDKYKKQVFKEKYAYRRTQERKLLGRIKRDSFKKAYSRKPVINPYIHLYTKHRIVPDPTLLQRYNSKPLYSIYTFRHLTLPKSNHMITAGQAWGGLEKSWIAFKIWKSRGHTENMHTYASVLQRWTDLLELPFMPDFPDLNLSAESFRNARNLKLKYDDEN
jgi:hypothetical protein